MIGRPSPGAPISSNAIASPPESNVAISTLSNQGRSNTTRKCYDLRGALLTRRDRAFRCLRRNLEWSPSELRSVRLPLPQRVLRGWLERQCESIHAVAQARRLGSVVENMSEMATAAPAMHFGS